MFTFSAWLAKRTKRFSWSISFIHIAVLTGICLVSPTWTSFWIALILHVVRMFAITAGYHRYFAHQTFETSRLFQFILAFLGCMSLQKGPLWWAFHHRRHHKFSDTSDDPHSPIPTKPGRWPALKAMWWGHFGWVLLASSRHYDREGIKEFWVYPELRILGKLHWVPAMLLAALCFWIDGWSGLAWGFGAGTIFLYHSTFLVNSACHLFGFRRYETGDHSRNLWWAAILTLGEGWHNNHHHYQSAARQGFRWWEIDISYYILCLLRRCRIVWDMRHPTAKALAHKLITKVRQSTPTGN